MSAAHKVLAAAVTLKDTDGKIRYHYKGAVVPSADYDPDVLARLVDEGILAEYELPEAPEPDAGDDTPPPAPSTVDGGEPAQRPAKVASKPAWIAYAISQGADAAWANDQATTKDDLIARYGGA